MPFKLRLPNHIKERANGELFDKTVLTFKPGLTVLVGRNGAGKTTLINTLEKDCTGKQIKYLRYDNLTQGGNHAYGKLLNSGNISGLAERISSSEGENIILNIGSFCVNIGRAVSNLKGDSCFVVLMDAIDSGLSIDRQIEFAEEFNAICEMEAKANPNLELYIIVAANSFELARIGNAFDVKAGKYRNFKTYESFKKFITKDVKAV